MKFRAQSVVCVICGIQREIGNKLCDFGKNKFVYEYGRAELDVKKMKRLIAVVRVMEELEDAGTMLMIGSVGRAAAGIARV